MPCTFNPSMFHGQNAFYKTSTPAQAKSELSSTKALKPIYECRLENRVWRIVKLIFAIICFPIGLCQLFHRLAGKVAVLSSTPMFTRVTAEELVELRLKTSDEHPGWEFKRIAIQVDGYTIDAMIMGRQSTLANRRWTLYSCGNAAYYEQMLDNPGFKDLLQSTDSNALLFNYPGVGASSGMPSRNGMAKAYRAMLKFLEDQNQGIGAKEVIGLGHSIGGAAQAEALKNHPLKKDVNYVFIKDRTFSNATALVKGCLGCLVKVSGWNMDCVNPSLKLKAPEIIVQTEESIGDGIIPENASLGNALMHREKDFVGPKQFIRTKATHNEFFDRETIQNLTHQLNNMLRLPS